MSQLDDVAEVVAPERSAATRRIPAGTLPVLAGLAVAAQCYGLYGSAGPAQAVLFPGADKVEHLLGFLVPVALVLLSRRAWRQPNRGLPPSRSEVAVLALFVLQAGASEVAQAAFYRTRDGDLLDVVADLIGIALGWVAARRAARRWYHRAPLLGQRVRP